MVEIDGNAVKDDGRGCTSQSINEYIGKSINQVDLTIIKPVNDYLSLCLFCDIVPEIFSASDCLDIVL